MKIVFLEPLGLKVQQIEAACEGLKNAGLEIVIYPDRNENLDELKRRAEGAHVGAERQRRALDRAAVTDFGAEPAAMQRKILNLHSPKNPDPNQPELPFMDD